MVFQFKFLDSRPNFPADCYCAPQPPKRVASEAGATIYREILAACIYSEM